MSYAISQFIYQAAGKYNHYQTVISFDHLLGFERIFVWIEHYCKQLSKTPGSAREPLLIDRFSWLGISNRF